MNCFKLSRPFFLYAFALAVTLSSTLALAAEEHHDTPAVAHDVADSDNPRFKPERMWLPVAAQHLRPYLSIAVAQALKDEECAEILYARLNDYRTAYEEPTFTVLCKKDYKTTFNLVYKASDLDEFYDVKAAESEAVAQSAPALGADIEALRQSLIAPTAAIISSAAPAAEAAPIPEPQQQDAPRARRDEDPNDLSLDLDLDF